jgi:hypothetical protein
MADPFSKAINTLFVAGGVKEGVGTARSELKGQAANSFDNILGNVKPVKKPSVMGDVNAILNKSASETIDDLYKLAYHVEEGPDEYKKKRDYMPYAILGGILAAGAFDAYKKKDIVAPFRTIKHGLTNFMYEYPKKALGKTPGGRIMVGAVKAAGKEANGEIRAVQKSENIYRNKKMIDDVVGGIAAGTAFGAGDIMMHGLHDQLSGNDNMEKKAADEYRDAKHFIKTLVKEDFLQQGLKSVPYLAAPATISYMIGKDIRRGLIPAGRNNNYENVVIEFPVDKDGKVSPEDAAKINKKMQKTAGDEGLSSIIQDSTQVLEGNGKKFHESPTWKHFFKYEMPAYSFSITLLPLIFISTK